MTRHLAQKVLLDTSILIAPDADLRGFFCQVSSVSYAELHFGVKAGKNSHEKNVRAARVASVRARYGIGTPFTDDIALVYGDLCGLQIAAGRNPRARSLDLMIAATAVWLQVPLVTRNAKDVQDLGFPVIDNR